MSVFHQASASTSNVTDSTTPKTATGTGPIHAYFDSATSSQPLSGPQTGRPPDSSTTDR